MAKQTRKTTKAPARRTATSARRFSNRTAVGILGILLGLWLLYETLSIRPFRWGTLAEELIVVLCVVFALRLLCMAKLPGGLVVACLILLPAGVIVYGAYAAAAEGANFYRFLCLAGAVLLSLLTARLLDSRPDGVLVAFLLLLAGLPGLFAADTLLVQELMRLFLTAGVFFSMVSIRERSPWMSLCAALLFGFAGAAGLYAVFAAAGAAAGTLLFAPKKQRGVWVLSAMLAVGLALGALLLAKQYLPQDSVLLLQNVGGTSEWAAFLNKHLSRVLAVGVLLLAVRFFVSNEDAATPALLALLGGAIVRVIFSGNAPDLSMDTPVLAAIAGAGIAKTGRRSRR